MSDIPLTPINVTDYHVLLPELEAKLNKNQFPTVYKPVYIVVFSPLLTNDSLPIIVTDVQLLNDDKSDIKLNDTPSLLDYTSTIIVTDPPFPLSPESTPTITYPPVPIQNF